MEYLIPAGIVVGVILLITIVLYVKSIRFAGPNQAMLITSKPKDTEVVVDTASGTPVEGIDQSRVIINSRVFVNPISERVHYIDLSSRQVEFAIEAMSNNGIQLKLHAVAQVKVGGDAVSVRRAAQRFLDQQEDIDPYTQKTLSGSLRSIVGTLSVEEIIKDRVALNAAVKSEAEHSMTNQGLEIDTFQIESVDDPSGYLKNLGRPEAAAAKRNADIAEARAEQEAAQARAIADQEIAEAEQKLTLRRAELQQEADTLQAKADAAGPLAEAQYKEERLLREQQVVAREAELKERQLDVDVRKPADAAKYKVETEAAADLEKRRRDAEASTVEAQAQLTNRKLHAEAEKLEAVAQADASKARGIADADVEKARGAAEAEVIKSKGAAEASTIEARGLAEAKGVEANAQAYAKLTQAGVLNKVLETLPQIAEQIAKPMAGIDNMTVISNDGAGQLAKNVASGANETMKMLKDLTGIDVAALIKDFGKNGVSSENAVASIVSSLAQAKDETKVDAVASSDGKVTES